MKRLLSLMLALVMCCLTLSACAAETADAVAQDNAKGAVDVFASTENVAATPVVKLASSTGSTEITEAYGTITLSKPILYAISVSDLEKFDLSSAKLTKEEGMLFEVESATEYAREFMWSKISAVYAVPGETTMTLPSGLVTSDVMQIILYEENGVYRADELSVSLFHGFETVELPAPDPESAYLAVIDLEYSEWKENVTTMPGGGLGASGSAMGENDAGAIAFYVSKGDPTENPFGSSVPVTPAAPEAPAAPATPAPVGSSGFTDVADDAYYAEPVQWAVERGIANGTGDGMFSPDSECSTAHILTFLWRAKGSPEPTSTTNPFTDVQESDYYYKAALWAKEAYVLPMPFNPDFRGDAPCTRGMAMLYIWKAAGSLSAKERSGFTDVSDTALYAPAVDWAVENGVTTGMGDGTFGSENTCTRGQIMAFLWRAFQ